MWVNDSVTLRDHKEKHPHVRVSGMVADPEFEVPTHSGCRCCQRPLQVSRLSAFVENTTFAHIFSHLSV